MTDDCTGRMWLRLAVWMERKQSFKDRIMGDTYMVRKQNEGKKNVSDAHAGD